MPENPIELFPHAEIRGGQLEFMNDIAKILAERKILVANAPTGIGKTAAVISKALECAMQNGKFVIFATPRNSQHRIALETMRDINQKHKTRINAVDFVGKQWLCNQEGIEKMSSSDFMYFCKSFRKDGKCVFYKNTIFGKSPAEKASDAVLKLLKTGPHHSEELKKLAYKFCPYEMSVLLAQSSQLIVCDYYHVFSGTDTFFAKIQRDLDDAIIIIDEAHNLPSRIRKIMSSRLTNFILDAARKEALALEEHGLAESMEILMEILFDISSGLHASNSEGKNVEKEDFMGKLAGYNKLAKSLEEAAEIVREEKKHSALGSVAEFLVSWPHESEGFSRIIMKSISAKHGRKAEYVALYYDCLDPAMLTKKVFDSCHAAILMSGTLNPAEMYRDLLGLGAKRTLCADYSSPFPESNRLNIIVEGITTQYKQRSAGMYNAMAECIETCLDALPKKENAAVFFPSYDMRDKVMSIVAGRNLLPAGRSLAFLHEMSSMTKHEKADLIKNFLLSRGAVLTGAQAGSVAEGVDYPDNKLKMVIIVGLSLEKPDLKVRALIDYYDMKFRKGWEYAYSYPAVQRAIQSSGRCIRSEKDIGICIFMDERFTWQNYSRIFPKGMKMLQTKDPAPLIREFFKNHQHSELN